LLFDDTDCTVLSACQYKSTAEAVVDAVRAILRLCEESKTVKRVIHTASITAASPLMKKGSGGAGYKDFISESCWTPLDVDYPLRSAHFDVSSESSSERLMTILLILSFKKTTLLITGHLHFYFAIP
jgi:hypothetical protein